ncbi:MAG: class I SAM-dependent methyltransferase [Moorea sp. SIO4A3]|nr:class I SAM-dependent methyltransferase [Moorena sp. SIO4A3]
MSNLLNSNLPSTQPLPKVIANHIATAPNQRITFAQYMDLALYHPQLGYYATGAVNIGSSGDFFTSPHLGKDFGELLAEQFAQMWDILGQPNPFTLMEMGAGQGLLAADVLVYLHQHYPDCYGAVNYIIVEKATAMIAQQKQLLLKLNLPKLDNHQHSLPVRWCSWEEIQDNSVTGCCFSNELVDALPVHQVVLQAGDLKEIYIATVDQDGDDIKFVEVLDTPSTPQLREYFDLVGIDLFCGSYPEGYRSEVNLAALDWKKTVAKRLNQGFVLTIDYGYPAQKYYLPARDQGTLQCYYRHRHHNNPYSYIGEQDITAHVDFTALERQGDLCGLGKVGFTKQGLFLMALGLGDRIAALSDPTEGGNANATAQDVIKIMQRRQRLHQLIDPTGLGGFGVLIQSKGLTPSAERMALKGLTVPPISS